MLKTFDETVSNAKDSTRPQSLKVRRISNRENESELKKAQSFKEGKSTKRRHLSTITRPDFNRLESPERGGTLPKFSRNVLRMSLGSRESRSRSYDAKYSPRNSPYSSKRSIFKKEKTSNPDVRGDVDGIIPEDNLSNTSGNGSENGDNGINNKGKKQLSLSLSLTSTNSGGTENDSPLDRSLESIQSTKKSIRTPPVKDRRRKISLPTFLQTSGGDRGKHPDFVPYKTPSVEIEVYRSDENGIKRVSEITEHDSVHSSSEFKVDSEEAYDSVNQESEAEIRKSIDWTREEDWPKWQLEVVSSGRFTSPETTL